MPELKIDSGRNPQCGVDGGGTLHIAYLNDKGMVYAQLKNGIVTTKVNIPNSPKKTFSMTVDGRGYIHLFWCEGYMNNVAEVMKKPVNVDLGPYEGKKRRCLTYQIATSSDDESV